MVLGAHILLRGPVSCFGSHRVTVYFYKSTNVFLYVQIKSIVIVDYNALVF